MLSETQHKTDKKKASATEESDKMLDRQNFSICDAAEHCTMNPPGMNSERARHIEASNRTAPRRKFVSEEEKEAQRQAEQCVKCRQQDHYAADCQTD